MRLQGETPVFSPQCCFDELGFDELGFDELGFDVTESILTQSIIVVILDLLDCLVETSVSLLISSMKSDGS
jgi:hypothetical protein